MAKETTINAPKSIIEVARKINVAVIVIMKRILSLRSSLIKQLGLAARSGKWKSSKLGNQCSDKPPIPVMNNRTAIEAKRTNSKI